MPPRQHIVGIVVCAVLVAAFEHVAIIWSLADFHPGHIPDFPDSLHRRARLGNAMFLPFELPLRLVSSVVGGSASNEFVQWLLLPLLYGAVLYSVLVLIRRSISSHASRNA
jgi:hypothetical protein